MKIYVCVQKCPFRAACINGHLEKVASMIENNPSLERVVDKGGWNGLHHAAAEGPALFLLIKSSYDHMRTILLNMIDNRIFSIFA